MSSIDLKQLNFFYLHSFKVDQLYSNFLIFIRQMMEKLVTINRNLFSTFSCHSCLSRSSPSSLNHHVIKQYHQNFSIEMLFFICNRTFFDVFLNYYKLPSIRIFNANTLPAFSQLNLLQSGLFMVDDALNFSYTVDKLCLMLPIIRCTYNKKYD